jgi:hypothetical protein
MNPEYEVLYVSGFFSDSAFAEPLRPEIFSTNVPLKLNPALAFPLV